MGDHAPSLNELQEAVLRFATARDWLPFHNPRNLAAALIVEAGELLHCFQWLPDEACLPQHLSAKSRRAIESELADVLLYALTLANALNVSAATIVLSKLHENEGRFPAITEDKR